MNHLSDEEVNGPWQPLTPAEAASIMAQANYPWWFAGGYAIEFFIGEQYAVHGE
jgi:hypothetical protein